MVKKKKVRDIGIDATPPKEECDDPKCPWHGHIKIRGRVFEGKVVSKYLKTVAVEWEYFHKVPKYERYERRKSRVYAHLPPCIHVEKGDIVRIGECRPISKIKHFVVIEKLNKQ